MSTSQPVCLLVMPSQGEGPPGDTLSLAVGSGRHQEVLKRLGAVQGLVREHVRGFRVFQISMTGRVP